MCVCAYVRHKPSITFDVLMAWRNDLLHVQLLYICLHLFVIPCFVELHFISDLSVVHVSVQLLLSTDVGKFALLTSFLLSVAFVWFHPFSFFN